MSEKPLIPSSATSSAEDAAASFSDPRMDYPDTSPETAGSFCGDTLVVGDWVVDENWITGIHRSETASRTGQNHIRSLHGVYSSVMSLGGAGHMAALLFDASKDEPSERQLFKVLGIGLWHGFDTALLRRLFWSPWLQQITPYRLSAFGCRGRRPVDVPPDPKLLPPLFNLANTLQQSEAAKAAYWQFLADDKKTVGKGVQRFDWHGTNRVVRIFQEQKNKLRQISRLDWHLAVPYMGDSNRPAEWITERKTADVFARRLSASLGDYKSGIKRVVVGDLVKGVVSRLLIDELLKIVPENAEWFISTKSHEPEWLSALASRRVRLVLFHEAAARAAIRAHVVDQWFTKTNRLTKSAMKFLQTVHDQSKSELVVVAPDGWRVAARMAVGSRETPTQVLACVQSSAEIGGAVKDGPVSLPLTASLVLLGHQQNWTKESLQQAHLLACNRVAREAERQLTDGGSSKAERLPFTLKDLKPELAGRWDSRDRIWKNEDEEWDDATRELCCVTKDGRPSIELWRAMTTLDGYVCLCEDRKRNIQRVIRRVRDFKNRSSHERKTLSFMFRSAPGNGKTFLVSRLAAAMEMTLLEFDISQFTRREDILDCFDTIVTRQATSDREIITFVDEINAQIDGQQVYPAFLGPLESGNYVRGGRTFSIRPCVWVFAGTGPLTSDVDSVHSDKGSDFETRLTLSPIQLDSEGDPLDRFENIYLGVVFVKKTFPDVREIGQEVLRLFYNMDPRTTSLREMRKTVETFEQVKYGQITLQNVPPETRTKYRLEEKHTPHPAPLVHIDTGE